MSKIQCLYCPKCERRIEAEEKLWCWICSTCRRVIKEKINET